MDANALTTTEDAIRAKISAFAVWADKAISGWRSKIDTERLDMTGGIYRSVGCGCIGAQLESLPCKTGYFREFQSRYDLSDNQCEAFCLVAAFERPWWPEEWTDGTVDRLWIEEISREGTQSHGQD